MALGWTVWLSIILIQPESHPVINVGIIPPAPPTLEREMLFTTLHIIAFATTMTAWWWALIERLPLRRALIAAAILTMAVGIFTESMQAFAPDRYPSLIDMLANVGGALVAAYVINRKWPNH